MPTFELKLGHELTQEDFTPDIVWVDYCAPDDLEPLGDLGFDLAEVDAKLGAVNYSDDYCFRVAAHAYREFGYQKTPARISTPSGHTLVGYDTGPAVGVFVPAQARPFIFNINMPKECLAQGRQVAEMLGEATIFPRRVEVFASGEVHEFPMPAPGARYHRPGSKT